MFRQWPNCLAQLKRPYLTLMAGFPTAQIVADCGGADTRLFRQFTQGCLPDCLALFKGPLHQLYPCLRMAKQKDPGGRSETKNNWAGFVSTHGDFLIVNKGSPSYAFSYRVTGLAPCGSGHNPIMNIAKGSVKSIHYPSTNSAPKLRLNHRQYQDYWLKKTRNIKLESARNQ